MEICNVSRIVSDVYSLVADGLSSLDVIVNILGRKLSELGQNGSRQKSGEISILIILVQNDVDRYKLMSVRGSKK
jgi:hypothetical protein